MSAQENDRLENLLLDDSFVRFIKGIASEEERVYWQEWQRQHPDNQGLVRDAKELIQFTGYDERRIPDPHIELKKFKKSLKTSSFSKKKPSKKNVFRSGKRIGNFWLMAAATIVITILTIGILQFLEIKIGTNSQEKFTTISTSDYQTGYGEKAFLHLTDGSRIVLNANSHLTYSWSDSGTSGHNIDIHLEGEAWFDIEPLTGESARVLRVHTRDGIVEVTGTVFTVQTSSKGTRTVLQKGEVQVRALSDGDSDFINKAILKPGEMARLSTRNDQIKLEQVNPEVYTSWIRDVWTFEQTPLDQIAERIETVFGIEVTISPNDLKKRTLSGTISSTNLQLIKEGLSEALQVQVKQVENTIIIGPE